MGLELDAVATDVSHTVPLLRFLAAFLERRRALAWMAIGGIVLVTAFVLIRSRTYSSTLTFMPQASSNSLAGLAGVAAQFGIAVPSGSPDQTPQFYSELIATEPFQEDLASTTFSAVVGRTSDGKRDSVQTQPLVDWLGIDPDRPFPERLGLASLALQGGVLTVIPDVQTSMVTVNIRTNYPDLSKAIAERVLELVNRFNTVRRGGDAGVERRFAEGRLSVARDSLTAAEDRIRGFLERNRTFANSPMLALEHDRLQREVDFDQQVVATLMQAVEQARITEVRNTPAVTVVEAPRIAGLPDRRRLLLKWTLTLILVSITGTVWVVLDVGYRAEATGAPDASTQVLAAWEGTRADLHRLATPFLWVWNRIRRSRT